MTHIHLISQKQMYAYPKFKAKMGLLLNEDACFIADCKYFCLPYFHLFYFKCLHIALVFTEPTELPGTTALGLVLGKPTANSSFPF